MNEKSSVFLICRPCDDSYYPGHPIGIAFETREMAQKYLDDNNLIDDEYPEGDYYISEIKLFG